MPASEGRRVLLIQNGAETDRYRIAFEGGEPEDGSFDACLSALEPILTRHQPEVIVLDLEFPIRDGVELLRLLTTSCPGAEIMTRVRSRHLEPLFFSIRSSSTGLSLEPLGVEEQGRLSLAIGLPELAL